MTNTIKIIINTRDYSDYEYIDHETNNSISNDLFGLWLQLWIETLDETFEGKKVNLAKNRARNIASYLFMEIFKSR